MWLRRALLALTFVVVVTPLPALVAPYVSARPVDWAYRVYHPGLYRYPQRTGTELHSASMELLGQPRWKQSLMTLRLMIQY